VVEGQKLSFNFGRKINYKKNKGTMTRKGKGRAKKSIPHRFETTPTE